MTTTQEPLDRTFDVDVLVIGGGIAGGWSAIGAAQAGASVLLVDKGYLGTSGVMATAGVGHWWVPPEDRERALDAREQVAFGIGDREWMSRTMAQTWETLPSIGELYRFPRDDDGNVHYRTLRGPEYGRALRRFVKRHGVTVLDHAPALELLVGPDGVVGGAQGVLRQPAGHWRARAGAVVLATGGTAFKSHLLGCYTNTGDGQLMGAEAGAELSGMEFSSSWSPAAVFSTMTRGMAFGFGRYFDADLLELDFSGDRRSGLAKAMIAGPVYTVLDQMPAEVRAKLPAIQPNFMLPFDRVGIDPFTQPFEVVLRPEGTIRGTGGLRIMSQECQTTVPGLYAAGDAATCELVAGATSGGGAQNSAWALSSGTWAGRGAAAFAGAGGPRLAGPLTPIGEAGIHPSGATRAVDTEEVVRVVQGEMHPLEKTFFRSGEALRQSLEILNDQWREVREHLGGDIDQALPAREAAAMVAVARWCTTSALVREETRGMHQRTDATELDPSLTHRLLVGGLDEIWVRPEAPVAAAGGTR